MFLDAAQFPLYSVDRAGRFGQLAYVVRFLLRAQCRARFLGQRMRREGSWEQL